MQPPSDHSALFVVATPIGNLDDITARALKILGSADLIACEDTRVTRKLLSHFNLTKPELIPYSNIEEASRAEKIVARMKDSSLRVCLVSDAGTPCISDPGYRLVRLAQEAGITVYTIPGPSSLTAFLSSSGLPTDRFSFIGFLPRQNLEIRNAFSSWIAVAPVTVVFFESARRLESSLKVLSEALPQGAEIAIGRELTKLYEEIWRGSLQESVTWLASHTVLKGEVVAGVHFKESDAGSEMDDIEQEISRDVRRGVSTKEILQRYKDSKMSRNEVYNLILKLKN